VDVHIDLACVVTRIEREKKSEFDFWFWLCVNLVRERASV